MGMGHGFMGRVMEDRDKRSLRDLDRQVVRMFGGYLRRHAGKLAMTITAMLVVAGVNMLTPYLSKVAIDQYIVPRDSAGLNLVLLAYVAAYGVYWVASFWGSYLSLQLGQRVVADMREDLFKHVTSLSLDFFAEQRTGGVMSRLTNDIDSMLEFVSSGIVNLVSGVVTILGIGVVMFILSPRLAAVVLLVIPLIFLGTSILGSRIRQAQGTVRQKVGALNAGVEENLSGIRVVKAMSQESGNMETFEKLNKENLAAHIKAVAISALFFPFMSISTTLSTALVVLAGGIMVARGEATIGLLMAFMGYTSRFFMPLREMSQIYNVYQTAAASAERIYKYFKIEPKIVDPQHPRQLRAPVAGEIEFHQVRFEYQPGHPVITGLELAIPAGQTTAVVGPTGAGKSTLVKLLARLYDPTEGSVTIDGIDIKEMAIPDLREAVMVVPQEVFLFSGTIKENIRYGKLEASDAEVYQAAENSCADRFISQLPNGYDTEVGEGGALLSGGQRQLIAFARAILADRPILILDEATSSVDAATEVFIQQALDHLLEGRTSLIIAHRFTTLRRARKVIVLESGKVVGYDTHENLLEQVPLYQSLYEKQWGN